MSTVSLPTSVLTRACELFAFFAKKAAFNIEEYSGAGPVFDRILNASKSETSAEVTVLDVQYLISAITVCSGRTPVEVANYKTIADLLESLQKSLKKDEDLEEKEEPRVTEL
jgi:hypothetical protein